MPTRLGQESAPDHGERRRDLRHGGVGRRHRPRSLRGRFLRLARCNRVGRRRGALDRHELAARGRRRRLHHTHRLSRSARRRRLQRQVDHRWRLHPRRERPRQQHRHLGRHALGAARPGVQRDRLLARPLRRQARRRHRLRRGVVGRRRMVVAGGNNPRRHRVRDHRLQRRARRRRQLLGLRRRHAHPGTWRASMATRGRRSEPASTARSTRWLLTMAS